MKVEQVTTSKSGKALRVKAGGTWYGAKKDSGITAGMEIDAIIEDGNYGPWIAKYKVTTAAPAQAPATAPVNGGDHHGLTGDELRFVSNIVGTAIQAGKLTDPAEISAWAKAARMTLKELA